MTGWVGLEGPATLVAALAIDAVVGDPAFLWRRLPHPVVLAGGLVAALERGLNRPAWTAQARRLAGVGAVAVLVLAAGGAGLLVQVAALALLPAPWGLVAIAAAAAILLAQKSLDEHVAAVARGLDAGLGEGRAAVAMVVGRDVSVLDAAGVARAAIETTAENFSDGVVAPAFWFALLGLPGIAIYKAVNTADSMIGHLDDRHRDFGWAAARLDDVLNLVPARFAGGLVALAAGRRTGAGFHAMARDARLHASPNAGWPEAAMAGGLGVALLGPTTYDGVVDAKPWLNPEGRRDMGAADVRRGLALYRRACVLHAAIYAGLAAALWI